VYVEAGPHRFEARHAGADPAVLDINAKRGETIEATLELRAQPKQSPEEKPPVASPPADTAASAPANYVPAIVTASVGGLALAGGVVFLVLRSGSRSDASNQLDALEGNNPCGAGTPYAAECAEVADLSDQAATFGTLSIVSFGVAAGAGVATFFLWPKDRDVMGLRAVRPSVAASTDRVFATVSGSF
jgi:hypothetical protein